MPGRMTVNRRGECQYYINGKEVMKAEWDEAFPAQELGVPGGHLPTCWPLVSEALAVHPKQVTKANERNKRHGVNVTYDPKTGNAILPDRGERKKLLRLEGYHDNHAGYGD